MARGRDRHTETLVPVARAGFGDETASLFDPTTKRVSTRALKQLIAETIDADSPTTHIPIEQRPPPIKPKSQRVLEELKARRSGESLAESFGRYTLLGSVGKGGMAEVRLAAENAGGSIRLCVIKRIASSSEKAEQHARTLMEEARVCRRLDHPNIVKLLDSGSIDGAPFAVFELIDGVSLRELGDLVKPLRLPLRAVLEIANACAAALAHAHALGVVHRDVTPQNVLVARDGAVKLVDFGIARFEGREHETRKGHVKGKLGYMAPEQCRPGPVDGKADIFTLSLVLTELIAGERVLPPQLIVLAESESIIRTRLEAAQYEVPRSLADLLVRMAALDAKDRPSALDVLEALEPLLERAEGEALAEFTMRSVFAQLEPFEEGLAIDQPTVPPQADWSILATEPSYARTMQLLRPVSGPKDDAATRLVAPISSLPIHGARSDKALTPAFAPEGKGLFIFVLSAAIVAFLTLVFVLTR